MYFFLPLIAHFFHINRLQSDNIRKRLENSYKNMQHFFSHVINKTANLHRLLVSLLMATIINCVTFIHVYSAEFPQRFHLAFIHRLNLIFIKSDSNSAGLLVLLFPCYVDIFSRIYSVIHCLIVIENFGMHPQWRGLHMVHITFMLVWDMQLVCKCTISFNCFYGDDIFQYFHSLYAFKMSNPLSVRMGSLNLCRKKTSQLWAIKLIKNILISYMK